jgi:outer membrane protein OmpA-like peptidoglycan-associated protein
MQRRRSLVVLAGVILFGLLFLGPVLSNHFGRWFNGWSGVSGIESHLEDEAREVLSGLNIDGATVDADGRNLSITTPDVLSRAAQNNLKAIDGVGSIDLFSDGVFDDGADTDDGSADTDSATDADTGDVDEAPAEPEPTAVPEPTGGEVLMVFDGEQAVLTGEVQSAEGRDSLARAARRIAGDTGVVDEMTLADSAGGPSDLEAVTTAAAVIRRVDEWYESATVELSGDELVVSGLAKTQGDADRAKQVVEQLAERVGLNATVDAEIVTVEPTPAPSTDAVGDGDPDNAAAEVVAALDLSGVTFELGTAELTAEAQGILDDVAGQLLELPGVAVQVQGHTDDQGDPDVNLLLSQERAEAVRNYLIGAGVDAGALTARGFGASQPIADNSTAEGQAANRRVDLSVAEGN